jgi:uncharacterized protein
VTIAATDYFQSERCFAKREVMERKIEHTWTSQRGIFFIEQDGKRLAELTYARANDLLIIVDHTEVDPDLRGKGIARKLLAAAVNWARENHIRIKPTCSFAVAQFARDQSIRDVLA